MIKKFILLAGLVSSYLAFGQKDTAVITFKDGKVVNGYADLISQVNKKGQIAIKETKEGKKNGFFR